MKSNEINKYDDVNTLNSIAFNGEHQGEHRLLPHPVV